MANDENKLQPAYLIVGEDELKRQRALTRLRSRIASMGDLEFNHDDFDGESASGSDIAAACNTLPFASDCRLVEVKNGDKLVKQDQEVLVAYLASPCASTVLAFSCAKLAKNTRLYKAFASIGKCAVIDCSPMKRYQLVRALRSMAVEHGFTITESGAEQLVNLVGEDTVRLDSELRKISLAVKGTEAVSERMVLSLVARTTEIKPWELLDALCERNLRQCLVLLSQTEDSPLKLLALCTSRLRELACAKTLEQRGESHLLAQTLGVPSWRVKNHIRWSRNYSDYELKRAFSLARDCELLLKSASADSAFGDWLNEVVANK